MDESYEIAGSCGQELNFFMEVTVREVFLHCG